MAVDPYSTAIAGVGAVANFFAGRSAAKSQKEYNRRLAQGADLQNQVFRQSIPVYQQLIQQYAQRALPQSVGGQFGAERGYGSPEDQLRLRAAEEDVNRYYQQQANQLRNQLGGTASRSTLDAALARLGTQQAQQLSGFRRGLAIQSGQEQERRLGELARLLGIGFGQGGQAAQAYGQLGAQYGQQANQAFGGLGDILQQFQYSRALQGLGQQQPLGGLGSGGTMDTYGFAGAGGTSPAPGTIDYEVMKRYGLVP